MGRRKKESAVAPAASVGSVVNVKEKRRELVMLDGDEARGVIEGLCDEAGVEGGFDEVWESMTNNEHRHNPKWRRAQVEEDARQVLLACALVAQGNVWRKVEAATGVTYGRVMVRCHLKPFRAIWKQALSRRDEAFAQKVMEAAVDLGVNGDEIPVVNAKGDVVAVRRQRSPQAQRLVMEAVGVIGAGSSHGSGGGAVTVGGGTGNVFNIVLPERMSVEEFERERGRVIDVAAESAGKESEA